MMSRSVAVFTGLLAVSLVVQLGASWLRQRGLEVGDRVSFSTLGPDSEPVRIPDETVGSCAYLILADPTCGSCATARQRWARDVALQPGLAAPSGWAVRWVIMAPAAMAESFAIGGPGVLPVEWSSMEDRRLLTRLGIAGFPAYAVLDREGGLVDSGVGARLPPRDAFRQDCTIDA